MLLPLLRDMLAEDPTERPSAADALQHLRAIRREVPFIQRIWRPRKRIEPLIVTILCDLWSLVSGLFFYRLSLSLRLVSVPLLIGTFSDDMYIWNDWCVELAAICCLFHSCVP